MSIKIETKGIEVSPSNLTKLNLEKDDKKNGVVVLPSQREAKAKLRSDAASRVLHQESYATQPDKKLALVYFAKTSFTDHLENVIRWGVELDAKTLKETWFWVNQRQESARQMLVKQNIKPVTIQYKKKNSEELISVHDFDMPGYKNLIKILDNVIKRLPEAYEPVTEKEKCDAVIWAAQHARPEIVKFVLEQSTDNKISVQSAVKNEYGITPLMAACRRGRKDIVEVLLKQLATNPEDLNKYLNQGDCDGITALMWAAKYGHTEIVRLLLNNGTDKTIEDAKGRTAADWATWGKNKAIEAMLKPVSKPRYYWCNLFGFSSISTKYATLNEDVAVGGYSYGKK